MLSYCFRVRVGVCRQRWGTFNTLKQMRLGLTLASLFLACSFSYCSLWGTAVSLTSDIAFNYGWNSSTESGSPVRLHFMSNTCIIGIKDFNSLK